MVWPIIAAAARGVRERLMAAGGGKVGPDTSVCKHVKIRELMFTFFGSSGGFEGIRKRVHGVMGRYG